MNRHPDWIRVRASSFGMCFDGPNLPLLLDRAFLHLLEHLDMPAFPLGQLDEKGSDPRVRANRGSPTVELHAVSLDSLSNLQDLIAIHFQIHCCSSHIQGFTCPLSHHDHDTTVTPTPANKQASDPVPNPICHVYHAGYAFL